MEGRIKTMRKYFVMTALAAVLFSVDASAADFIHPMDFDGSEAQKKKVIQIIKARVRKDYCGDLDMCQPTTLRMMEKANLDAFKKAAKAENRQIMDRVISDYCGDLDMCSYSTIQMMYEANLEASRKELEW